jgi:hypothetical protein
VVASIYSAAADAGIGVYEPELLHARPYGRLIGVQR